MADSDLHQHLADAENALAIRKRQRSRLDREIEALEQVIRLEREVVYRDGDLPSRDDQDHPRIPGSPRYGSKQDRIRRAIKEALAEHGTMHRTVVARYLEERGLIGGGEDVLPTTSTYLSRLKAKGEVVSNDNGNWSLPPSKAQEVLENGPLKSENID
jgi:hypothetical protein